MKDKKFKTIEIEQAMQEDAVFVDTRTPKEFEEDNIPGSINIPIFSNDERHEIGLLYKQNNEKGIELGKSIYEKKMAELKDLFKDIDKKKHLIIYCWRGGLRSKTVTQLVTELEYNAHQLVGGYKEFRLYTRDKLNKFKPKFKFIVLRGLAGCGKTEILQKIEPSIDLEGLANHRGSLFGAIGKKPNTQKHFESRLYELLLKFKDEKYVFVEGESQKIGNLYIPNNIYKAMNDGITIRVNRSIENRSKQIINDYFTHNEDAKIIEIIKTLKQFLSTKTTEHLINLMKEKNYFEVSKILLEDYYDSKYLHMIERFKTHAEVKSDDVNECVNSLKKLAKGF